MVIGGTEPYHTVNILFCSIKSAGGKWEKEATGKDCPYIYLKEI